MSEWLLSRRDRLIVVRHEHVFSVNLCGLKGHDNLAQGLPWYLLSVISESFSSSSFVLGHTVPYGTGSFGWRFSRHFVPGYDRKVPPGQFATGFS
jgi:hypothetical protein